ncbi:hypothetical protein ACGFJ7_41855 [Actinoplanes sp. NPDC048988]|uniref:hypothetical protein n=1 Tax=Actinoplanes sp. NPDC048988 TaxID=3363901 RepID=UPI00371EE957
MSTLGAFGPTENESPPVGPNRLAALVPRPGIAVVSPSAWVVQTQLDVLLCRCRKPVAPANPISSDG